jgi:hypothetical protein
MGKACPTVTNKTDTLFSNISFFSRTRRRAAYFYIIERIVEQYIRKKMLLVFTHIWFYI